MAFETWNDLSPSLRVIPVIVIDDAKNAVPLAETLVENGLPVIEVTLRTPDALDAIEAIASAVPDAIVGAGTVLDATHVDAVGSAGGRFLVAPGSTSELLERAEAARLPILPGAQTLSEVMALRSAGYRFLKFFPANLLGGAALLKAVSSVVSDVAFCPTGGLTMDNAMDYLDLPNVRAIGGSWIAPRDDIAAGNWSAIAARADAASRALNT